MKCVSRLGSLSSGNAFSLWCDVQGRWRARRGSRRVGLSMASEEHAGQPPRARISLLFLLVHPSPSFLSCFSFSFGPPHQRNNWFLASCLLVPPVHTYVILFAQIV